MDTRVASISTAVENEVCEQLYRHAIQPDVVEMARPLITEAVGRVPAGPLWLTLDWDDTRGRLILRRLPEGPLPGQPVSPGLNRAHHEAARLVAEHGHDDAVTVDLDVTRVPERQIDLRPADPALVPDDRPLHLIGLMGSEMGSGRSLEEAAARTGATVAEREARRHRLDDARDVAEAVIEAEAGLGADFEPVEIGPDRIVLRNGRCPFGPRTSPAMCRFTSALAGSLAARVAGTAEVAVTETLAAGDHECRLSIDLGRRSDRRAAHRYTWPAADRAPAGVPPEEVRGFQVTLSLQLPRDRLSVPVTRHLVRSSMQDVGVLAEDRDAVALAVTEACANVIDHSGPGDAYDVAVTISPTTCHIRVVDVGRGFDHRALSTPQMAGHDAEHGRGMALMHALVDQVRFESEPEKGTVVHLVKRLRFDENATARRLVREAGRRADAAAGTAPESDTDPGGPAVGSA